MENDIFHKAHYTRQLDHMLLRLKKNQVCCALENYIFPSIYDFKSCRQCSRDAVLSVRTIQILKHLIQIILELLLLFSLRERM